MIFELMSKGTMARLPKGSHDMPVPGVLLLLPYGRFLLGTVIMRYHEQWSLGRIGETETTEVFLYDDAPKRIDIGGTVVTLSAEVVAELRAALRQQMAPPGEHLAPALILRGLLRDGALSLCAEEEYLNDEERMIEELEKYPAVRMAYWAIRFALFRNDYEAVSRVKTWLKSAWDVFDEALPPPKIWFSLVDLPREEDREAMAALEFSMEDLQRMNSQSSRPVVLYSKAGYLTLSEFGGEGRDQEAAFRIWLFLPVPLWNEMREKRKLSIREIIMASWGYLDGLAAEREREGYLPLASLSRRDTL